MIYKRILSLLLALLMVLTILPAAMAEPAAEPTAVYAYSEGGIDFYACDETGTHISNTPVDPNTVTHLYLVPDSSDGSLYPLLIEDQTTLQWVTLLDPYREGLYLYEMLFCGYVNLQELHLPEQISYAEARIVENTSLRSFTLPEGGIHSDFFQRCNTIEEIINPTDNDVTLVVHQKDVTIPAGGTWKAEFGVACPDYTGATGTVFSLSLQAIGEDGVNPVIWSFTEDLPIPEGFTLTKDGLLTGKYPAQHDKTELIYVTAANGEKTANTYVSIRSCDPIDTKVILPDGVTLVDGPSGEKSLDTFALNTWTFANNSEDFQLCDVRLIQTYDDTSEEIIYFYNYTIRGNTLLLAAEACISEYPLTVEPIFAAEEGKLAETAIPLAFPSEKTVTDSTDVYLSSRDAVYGCAVYKADLKMGQQVDFTWAHPDNKDVDSLMVVFTKEEGQLEEIQLFDNDNVGVYGESGSFIVIKDATYYFFFMTYITDFNSTPVGCRFTVALSEGVPLQHSHLTECLDFTASDDLPEADKDGCWTWDAATKTMTLKDGLTMLVNGNNAINLPAGATLKVEGNATIIASYSAIAGAGSLTVELSEKADLTLIALQNKAIDLEQGLLKINGKGTSKFTVLSYNDEALTTGSYGMDEYDQETNTYIPVVNKGEIEINHVTMSIQCDDDAFETYEGNITLNGCKVTLVADSDGFICNTAYDEEYDIAITLNDCTLSATCGEQVFDAKNCSVFLNNSNVNVTGDGVFNIWDTVTVEGGRLVARTNEHSPLARFYTLVYEDQPSPISFTVKDATFYLTSESGLFYDDANISLSGKMEVLDQDGNILHSGEWDPAVYDALQSSYEPEAITTFRSVLAPADQTDCGVVDKLYLVDRNRIALELVGSLPENYVDGAIGWAPTSVSAAGQEATVSSEEPFSADIVLPDNWKDRSMTIQVTYTRCIYVDGEGWLPFADSEGQVQQTTEEFTVALKKRLAYGDLNDDTLVSAVDALMVLKFAVGKQELTEEQQIAAEVSGDKAIDAKDALLILQYAVNKIDGFPIEK